MRRTASALRVKWKTLPQEVQHLIAARKAAYGKLRSWTIDADMGKLTMPLYCARAGRKDAGGNVVFATPFKYVEAVSF